MKENDGMNKETGARTIDVKMTADEVVRIGCSLMAEARSNARLAADLLSHTHDSDFTAVLVGESKEKAEALLVKSLGTLLETSVEFSKVGS